jgi:hypothetical protein
MKYGAIRKKMSEENMNINANEKSMICKIIPPISLVFLLVMFVATSIILLCLAPMPSQPMY